MNTPKEIAIITAVCIATVCYFGWPVLRAWRARDWPRAVGKVIDTRIIHSSDSSDAKSRNYTVLVDYEYSVAGAKHEGKRVTFFSILMKHRSRDLAEQCRQRYAQGLINVLYNPKNPADSVLETDIPWGFPLAVGLGAIFVAGGLFTLVRMLTAQ